MKEVREKLRKALGLDNCNWTSSKEFEVKCNKCGGTASILTVVRYGAGIVIRCPSCETEEEI